MKRNAPQILPWPRHLCLAAAAPIIITLALAPLAAPAQVTPGGTLGDGAIFISAAGGETLDASGGFAQLGPDLALTFDTPIAGIDGSYEHDPSGADPSEIALSAGRHVVIYNAQFNHDSGSGNRAELQTRINLGGADLAIGRSQGYIRNASGADECITTGGGIITVGNDDDVLQLLSHRSDNNGGKVVVRTPGLTGITLLKLDDAWDFLSLEKAAADASAVGTAFTAVTYDTTVANTGAAFGYGGGGDVTLNQVGLYLFFANTGLTKPDNNTRTNYFQRLTLGGAEVPGTTTTTYIRGNESTDDGVAVIGTLLRVEIPGQVLNVEVAKEGGTDCTITGGNTALTIVKLPDTAEYIALFDDTEQPINDSDPVTFATQLNPGAPTFTHAAGGSLITINETSDYLFLASVFTTDDTANDNADRIVVEHGWSVNGGGLLAFGRGAQYQRDNGGSHSAGSWGGAAFIMGEGETVELLTNPLGAGGEESGGDALALFGLSISSLLPSNDPTVFANSTLALLINTTGPITSMLLRTEDADNTPAELTYTVTSAPTGGTLRHTVDGDIGIDGTFTQDDIDNGRIEFAAGGTPGTDFGFDFTVTDGGANPAGGTFTVAVGVETALADDGAATGEDDAITELDGAVGSVLANDTGTALRVVAADATSAMGAAVTVAEDGTFSYDPSAASALQALDDGGSAEDSFTYTTADFSGALNSATVTVAVAGANDAPVAGADRATGADRGAATLNLLANDTDVDAGDTLAVSGLLGGGLSPGGTATATSPQGATVTVAADGSFTYTRGTSDALNNLAPGEQITEVIDYSVSDGTAETAGTVTVVTTGVDGASDDAVRVDADATANFDALANDTVPDPAGGGVPLGGASYEYLASTAGNTDTTWNYTGVAGTLTSTTLDNGGVESILINGPANAPPGVTAVYSFSGNASGAGHEDLQNAAFGAIDQMDATFEMVFRPSDRTGNEVLWETGGNGTGASLVLLGERIVFTITGNNGPDAAQVVAPLPAGATAAGDFVHVMALIDVDGGAGVGTLELFVNTISTGTDTMRDLITGAPLPLNDWSGTDNGGIAIFSGTIGGDIGQLGLDGTTDIPGGMTRFAGEVALVRIYTSLLTPAERAGNFGAAFGPFRPAVAGDVADLAGEADPQPGASTVDLPSGAQVTFGGDGTFTYDPNGAFNHVATGLTGSDTFDYALNSGFGAVGTVHVTVDGQNPDPRVTIAADQASVGEGGTASFTFTAAAAVSGDVGVNLSYSGSAADGSDFNGQSSVTILDGQTGATLDLAIIDDGIFEGAETLIVTIDSVVNAGTVGAERVAATTLEDAQGPPEFTVAADQASVTEGSFANFTVSASVPSQADTTVGLGYSGTAAVNADFFGVTTLTVPGGEASAGLSILICEDAVVEGTETLTVTLGSPSTGTVGDPAAASTDLEDGAGVLLFSADFEGIDPLQTAGGTLINADAPEAANLGTALGSWEGVFTASAGGDAPGVILEGDDSKADGQDFALRLDRPGPGDGAVTARFASPADFSGDNTARVTLDLAQRRTQNNTEDKSTSIIGLDLDGEKSFELFLSANNNAPTNEQLHHVDAAGVRTPLGAAADFDNSNGYAESRLSRLTLVLTAAGYVVAIDRFAADGTPETVTGTLEYAGPGTQVAAVLLAISGSNDTAINGGIYLDDFTAVGIAGNSPPSVTAGGGALANGGSTQIANTTINADTVFDAAAGAEVQVADPDAGDASITVTVESVNGLGTVSAGAGGGGANISGAGTGTLTVTGSVADINLALAAGLTYSAGAAGGDEVLRLTVDDGGNTGVGGAQVFTHDFNFTVFANPTVTVEQAAGQADPTSAGPVRFTVVFSEDVEGFGDDLDDVDLGASTTPGALTAAVTGTSPTFEVAVSGMTGSGDVVVSIPAGAAVRTGTADPTEASTSVDDHVEFILNLPPEVAGLDRQIPYAEGAATVGLGPLAVSDANERFTAGIETALAPIIDYPAVDPATFTLAPGPVLGDGYALELSLSPAGTDVADGNSRLVWEIGGTSNGSGIYMIDGVPHLVSKMNATPASEPSGLDDADWGDTDEANISVPLAGAKLEAGATTTIALVFALDSVTFSVNGSGPTTRALANRGGDNNWGGDLTTSIGTSGSGRGGTTNTAGSIFNQGAANFADLDGTVDHFRFWNASDDTVAIDAIDRPETVTLTMTLGAPTDGTIDATGGAAFDPGTGVWSITGTVAEANAALAGAVFNLGGGTPPTTTITVAVDDGDEDGSPAATGTLTVVSPSRQWRLDFFGSPDNSGDAADDNDFNNNGFTNLEDFLFGFDPAVPGSGGGTLTLSGGVITENGPPMAWADPATGVVFLRYARRADATAGGLAIGEQFSRDMALFEDNVDAVTVIGTGTGDGGVPLEACQVEFPAVLPVSGGKARFGRVQVTAPNP